MFEAPKLSEEKQKQINDYKYNTPLQTNFKL
jgi:hypothetical protein